MDVMQPRNQTVSANESTSRTPADYLFCLVDFMDGPHIIQGNWLTDDLRYAAWPPKAKDLTGLEYDKYLKSGKIKPEGGWTLYPVQRIRAYSDEFSSVRLKLKLAEDCTDTDLNSGKENTSKSDGKSTRKSTRKKHAPLSMGLKSNEDTDDESLPLSKISSIALPEPPKSSMTVAEYMQKGRVNKQTPDSASAHCREKVLTSWLLKKNSSSELKLEKENFLPKNSLNDTNSCSKESKKENPHTSSSNFVQDGVGDVNVKKSNMSLNLTQGGIGIERLQHNSQQKEEKKKSSKHRSSSSHSHKEVSEISVVKSKKNSDSSNPHLKDEECHSQTQMNHERSFSYQKHTSSLDIKLKESDCAEKKTAHSASFLNSESRSPKDGHGEEKRKSMLVLNDLDLNPTMSPHREEESSKPKMYDQSIMSPSEKACVNKDIKYPHTSSSKSSTVNNGQNETRHVTMINKCDPETTMNGEKGKTLSAKEQALVLARKMSDEDFKAYLILNFSETRTQMKELIQKFSSLSVSLQKSPHLSMMLHDSNNAIPLEMPSEENVLSGLPAVDMATWESFNGRLHDDKKYAAAVALKLKDLCGHAPQIGDFVRNVLSMVMTNALAGQFSWRGKKQKQAFDSQFFVKVLNWLLTNHTKYKRSTDDLKDICGNWLRLANQRLGGSKFEKYRCSSKKDGGEEEESGKKRDRCSTPLTTSKKNESSPRASPIRKRVKRNVLEDYFSDFDMDKHMEDGLDAASKESSPRAGPSSPRAGPSSPRAGPSSSGESLKKAVTRKGKNSILSQLLNTSSSSSSVECNGEEHMSFVMDEASGSEGDIENDD